MLGALIAVGTKARVSFVMGIHHCRRIGSTYTIFFELSPRNRVSPRWRCGYRNCEEANAAL
jgi:hypothetical protein